MGVKLLKWLTGIIITAILSVIIDRYINSTFPPTTPSITYNQPVAEKQKEVIKTDNVKVSEDTASIQSTEDTYVLTDEIVPEEVSMPEYSEKMYISETPEPIVEEVTPVKKNQRVKRSNEKYTITIFGPDTKIIDSKSLLERSQRVMAHDTYFGKVEYSMDLTITIGSENIRYSGLKQEINGIREGTHRYYISGTILFTSGQVYNAYGSGKIEVDSDKLLMVDFKVESPVFSNPTSSTERLRVKLK